jgi:hypothetical protein
MPGIIEGESPSRPFLGNILLFSEDIRLSVLFSLLEERSAPHISAIPTRLWKYL